MNWKQFKNIFKKEVYDETKFILGIDLGANSSVISFYDVLTGLPETIDLSGGYGKPSVPTAMQYISETKEWVCGEYAILNKGAGTSVTYTTLVEKLGKREYIDVDARSISLSNMLGIYLKDLIGNVFNINPKAVIVGIVAAIPSYLGDSAKEELISAFRFAGYEKELIGLYTDRTCVLSRYYHENKPTRERILMIDFGGREMRGGVYDANVTEHGVHIDCVSSLFDKTIGVNSLNSAVYEMFANYYCEQLQTRLEKVDKQTLLQLELFTHQHRDLIFQKGNLLKPIRLYYNFAYPPFQQNYTHKQVEEFVQPFANKLKYFINKMLEKNVYNQSAKISEHDIDTVICLGGGFEMVWAKKSIEDIFPDSNVKLFKNAKTAVAEGAAVLAACLLGVSTQNNITIDDRNQIISDIGVNIISDKKEKFTEIVERNAFWWQTHNPKMFLLNEKTDKPIFITFCKRDESGEVTKISDMVLDNLPIRPRGTTKIKLEMQFNNYNKIKIIATDCGFGEMFPKVDYTRECVVDLT